jgi:glutamate--cysteine ligase
MDPSRTAPVAGHHRRADPVEEWTAYALRARLMLIRACPDWFRPVVAPLPFGVWMARGHELGWPTLDDFAYHLTTLFPPVRPRGWLELRMVDAVPDPWWQVAVAVATTLLDDPAAFEVAERACAPVADRWAEAASAGLGHPGLAAAARQCFEAALDALPRLGADREAVTATEAYLERFVARGRCPADDLLDGWAAGGPAAVAGLLGEPAEADAGR